MRVFLRTVVVALLLGVAGCGNEDAGVTSKHGNGATVIEQVKRYYASVASGDGEAGCDALTEKAARGFESLLNGPVSSDCKTNIETLSRVSALRGAPRITSVKVTGEQATAHVAFESPRLESDVLLVRERDGWKLSQLPAILETAQGPPGFREHSDE